MTYIKEENRNKIFSNGDITKRNMTPNKFNRLNFENNSTMLTTKLPSCCTKTIPA